MVSDRRQQRLRELVVIAAFAILLGVVVIRHEPWRDELQAWLLARDSGSLWDLWRNSRYEGHPLLWHVLLMPLTRWVGHPVAMQVLHWGIAVAAAATLVFLAPFPLAVRAAVVFSYFPLFEYGAVSRNYALTVLGLWLAVAALARGRPVAAALASALAANASPMGVVLQVAFGAAIVTLCRSGRQRAVAAAVLMAGVTVSAWQLVPAPDYEHARPWVWSWDAARALWVARGHARALLPVQHPGLHFWESSPLFPLVADWQEAPRGLGRAVGALAIVGALVGWLLRRSPAALAMWLLGATSLMVFAYVKFPGAARHHGFLWVLLVAAVWLAVARGEARARPAVWILLPTLTAGVIGGMTAAWFDLRHPFSGARCAAERIQTAGLAHLPVVGGVDYAASGVAAYHPAGTLFYPSRGQWGSYILWDFKRLHQDELTPAAAVEEGGKAVDEGRGFVVLLNSPLAEPQTVGCRQVAQCTPTIVADESQWVYLCRTSGAEGDGRGE
ncbi:MAG: hypothetical protein HRF46_00215 [Acidobacteriota bacterium]|jgi:hypothetical protein